MKIRSVHAFAIRSDLVGGPARTPARRAAWLDHAEVANPMSRYPRFKRLRASWRPRWPSVACIVTAEDGQWGLGMTRYGSPVIAIVNEHLAPLLAGEPCDDPRALWEMMQRMTSPYAGGLSCYAVSAIDLALWDLHGKQLRQPVHRLLGSDPARAPLPVYATGNDVDWFLELGFDRVKLACPYGPADGERGLDANEALLRDTRALIGPDRALMIDCWMAFDLPYAIEFARRVRPLGLGWIEDPLMPEDFDGLAALRAATPGQVLAGGEHWYTPEPFERVLRAGSLDIVQPDIGWAGGLTGCLRVAELVRAAGRQMTLHAGMNTAYGQHLSWAVPEVPMGEYFVGAAPGVPLEEVRLTPGTPVPVRGQLRPSDEPGFGLGLTLEAAQALAV